jgi:hypothetical protein
MSAIDWQILVIFVAGYLLGLLTGYGQRPRRDR